MFFIGMLSIYVLSSYVLCNFLITPVADPSMYLFAMPMPILYRIIVCCLLGQVSTWPAQNWWPKIVGFQIVGFQIVGSQIVGSQTV